MRDGAFFFHYSDYMTDHHSVHRLKITSSVSTLLSTNDFFGKFVLLFFFFLFQLHSKIFSTYDFLMVLLRADGDGHLKMSTASRDESAKILRLLQYPRDSNKNASDEYKMDTCADAHEEIRSSTPYIVGTCRR